MLLLCRLSCARNGRCRLDPSLVNTFLIFLLLPGLLPKMGNLNPVVLIKGPYV
jgi:hypothetical protein